ncbi:MAG: hypothetical protein JW757_06460 [Anaerolineales bacterium]|nr:hypothetical protein [Anaerolineales bacterium]
MAAHLEDLPSIARSVKFYRFLLVLYPADFRQEYSGQMLQLFRDCCLRAYRQNGLLGMVRLWAVTFIDLVSSLIKEHMQKETNMSKSTFIRISGWALVLAGVAFFLIFLVYYLDEANPLLHIMSAYYVTPLYISAFYAGPLLLSAGLLGLRTRYGETASPAGSGMLLFGALAGPALSLVGIIGSASNDSLWIYHIYGPSVSMLFLAVFGIIALDSKPLPRGNALPLLAGIVLPVIMGVGLILGAIDGVIDRHPLVLYAPLAIQFLSMVALGIILQGDASEQESLAAA